MERKGRNKFVLQKATNHTTLASFGVASSTGSQAIKEPTRILQSAPSKWETDSNKSTMTTSTISSKDAPRRSI